MRQRLLKAGLFLTVGILISLAALVLARIPLAERAAKWQLSRAGIQDAQLTIRTFGFSGIRITDIALSDNLKISEAGARYSLLSLNLQSVRLRGVEISAAYREGVLDLGDLQSLSDSGGDPAEATDLPTLPDVELQDLRLNLQNDHGPLSLHLPGRLSLGKSGVIVAQSPLQLRHPMLTGTGRIDTRAGLDGSATISADFDQLQATVGEQSFDLTGIAVTADIQPDFLNLSLSAELPDLATEIAVEGAAAAPFDRPLLDAGLEITATDLALIKPLWPELPARGGDLTAFVGLSGVLPIATINNPQALIRDLSAQFSLTLEGSFQRPAELADAASIDLALSGSFSKGSLAAAIERGVLSANQPAPRLIPDALRKGGTLPILDETLRAKVKPDSTVEITNIDAFFQQTGFPGIAATGGISLLSGIAGPFEITGDLTAQPLVQFAGSISGTLPRLSADGLSLSKLTLAGPVSIQSDASATRLLSKGIDVSFDSLAFRDQVRLPASRLVFAPHLTATPCRLPTCAPQITDAQMTMRAKEMMPTLSDGTRVIIRDAELNARADADSLKGSGPVTTELIARTTEVPGIARVSGLRAKGSVDPGRERLNQKITAQTITIDAALYPNLPFLSLEAQLQGRFDDPQLDGQATIVGATLPPVSFTASPDRVRASLPPINPALLVNLARDMKLDLPDIQGLSGNISAELDHALQTGPTRVDIRAERVGATVGTVRMKDLSTRLNLNSLLPLSTEDTQRLEISALEAGIPLHDIALTYQVEGSARAPVLAVSTLTARMLDGSGSFAPFRIDPTSGKADLVLHLDNIDLEQAAEAMSIKGVSAEGRLSGRLPFAIRDNQNVAIRSGEMQSDGNGILRLPTPLIQDLLGGELDARLLDALGALANFHFTTLNLKVDKAFEGDASIKARIEGQNPEHLDGQPYILNVNVTGNADRLVETILTVYQASTGALQTGVEALR